MTPHTTAPPLQAQAIDYLFANWQGGKVLMRPAPPSAWPGAGATPEAAPRTPPDEPEPPPAIRDAADLGVANEWFQGERKRLREYTGMQLARIHREHQALIQQIYLSEQNAILRSQELSCKEELLTKQSRTLQQQTAELSVRERAVAARLEQWSRVQGQLADLCEARTHVEEETQEQRALLDALRLESDALRTSREATEAELRALVHALNEQRESRAREQAVMRAGQEQMEQRLRELDRAEQAAQGHVAELDELEARLRAEFEGQERQLAEQRREIAALRARVRQQAEAARPVPGTAVQ
jgi:DNA repair exonuclease SbcCD ATPase subunit